MQDAFGDDQAPRAAQRGKEIGDALFARRHAGLHGECDVRSIVLGECDVFAKERCKPRVPSALKARCRYRLSAVMAPWRIWGVLANFAVDPTAGSHSLAAVGHCGR